jgi:hypothetical protein
MHCERVFMSTGIWFQRIIGDPDGMDGFWMCPTPNCSGAGFTFDIFPTDPDHPANEGWHWDDDEPEEGEAIEAEDWDPDETQWKALDEDAGEGDDIEGEEWKHGLQPGEELPAPAWAEDARREHEQEERQYDEPDRRPRELDWSDREPRRPQTGNSEGIREDDIPF